MRPYAAAPEPGERFILGKQNQQITGQILAPRPDRRAPSGTQ